MLKFAILGFLNYQSLSGYDLEQQLAASTAHFWHARLSQIYMTLKKLETDGWVESEVVEQDRRPDKRVYTITAQGQQAFAEWLAKPMPEVESVKRAVLLKLFFARPLGKVAILSQLQLQLHAHQSKRREYSSVLPPQAIDLLNHLPELHDHKVLWQIVQDFGKRYEDMYIAWLEDAIQTIQVTLSDDDL